MIQNDQDHTTRDVAKILHTSDVIVVRHLKTRGYVNCYDVSGLRI